MHAVRLSHPLSQLPLHHFIDRLPVYYSRVRNTVLTVGLCIVLCNECHVAMQTGKLTIVHLLHDLHC